MSASHHFRRRRLALSLLATSVLDAGRAGQAADAPPEGRDDELAKSILEKADRIRFPAEGFQVAMAQRLTGLVANSDIARVNFTVDYRARLVGTEAIAREDHYLLELIAEERSVTYPRVMYWIRKSNNWPQKADFYSASSRLLRTCRFDGFEKMAGRVRPTRLVMEDAIHKGEQSVLEYSRMKLRDLPDKVFTKDYLKKLE